MVGMTGFCSSPHSLFYLKRALSNLEIRSSSNSTLLQTMEAMREKRAERKRLKKNVV